MAAAHRLRQGIRALMAFSQPVDYQPVVQSLNPVQQQLFRQMKRSEQLHSVKVLIEIQAQGAVPDDLAVAALLHDVGKSRYPLAIWQKTLAVLVRAFAPGLFRRWSTGTATPLWKRGFVVAVKHPQWSAEMVAKTQASERAIWLIVHHADSPTDWEDHPYLPLLKRLQEADDSN